MVVGTKARANGVGRGSIGVENSARADSRRWRDLHRACRIHHGCRIDGRHPDANFVLLEQVCDEVVEVDVGLGIVEVRQLVVVPGHSQ